MLTLFFSTVVWISGTIIFGVFAHTSLFDEYKEKVDAYTNAMMFAELIIAASRLNDPQAYHNILYRGYYPRLHKR